MHDLPLTTSMRSSKENKLLTIQAPKRKAKERMARRKMTKEGRDADDRKGSSQRLHAKDSL